MFATVANPATTKMKCCLFSLLWSLWIHSRTSENMIFLHPVDGSIRLLTRYLRFLEMISLLFKLPSIIHIFTGRPGSIRHPRHQVMKRGRPRFDWCTPAVWRFNATAGLGLHQRLILHGAPISAAALLELEGIRGLWSGLHFRLNNVLPAAAAVTLA